MSDPKHTSKIEVRVPDALTDEIERERKRMSRAAGAELNTSAVIRALLERGLKATKRTSRSREAA